MPKEELKKEEKLTYRLSLTDSENRAIQINISDPSSLLGADGEVQGVGVELLELYNNLLKSEEKIKEAVKAGDKKLAQKLVAEQEKQQNQLPTYTCPECKRSWKGGMPVCQNAGRTTGTNKRPPCVNFGKPI